MFVLNYQRFNCIIYLSEYIHRYVCVWNDLIFYLFIGRPGVTNGADGPAPLNGHERNGPDLAEAGHSSETSEAQASCEQSKYDTIPCHR